MLAGADFEIELYEDLRGRRPVATWLDEVRAQNRDLWAQTAAGIEKLRLRENHRPPLSTPIGSGLFELRTRSRRDISRVLYFFRKDRRIVLLHGFVKKTQKAPPSELRLARHRMRDYLERHGATDGN